MLRNIRIKVYDTQNHIEKKGYVRPDGDELMALYVEGARYIVSWEQVARALNTDTCIPL